MANEQRCSRGDGKILNVGATRLSWGNILDSDSILHAADRPFDVAMSGYSVSIYYLKTD